MNIFNYDLHSILGINSIISFILEIIFAVLSVIFFEKILKIQLSIKNKFIYITINLFSFILGTILGNPIYAHLLMLTASLLFLIFYIKASKETVFSYFCINSICTLNLNFLICYINSDFRIYIQTPPYTLISIISLLILTIISYIILKHIQIDNLLINSINEKSHIIIGTSILNLSIVYLIFFKFFEIISQNALYIIFTNIFFYISIRLLVDVCNNEFTKQKIRNLKLCNKTVLNLYDETRAFKHDFHNIIQAIGGYIVTNDIEGLKKYYKQVFNDCKISDNLSNLSPELINNPAIYSILVDKYNIANNNDIKINLNVMLDLNELNIKIYEFTRILGILLDNAIEASKDCIEKTINISFKKDKYKQLIIIENTYSDKHICIDKIFEKDFSTKPNNTGLGLWEVRKILNKNSNLNLYTTKDNDYFSQQLEIYSI